MSLRGFHIIFVIATVSVSTFFSVWALNQYKMHQTVSYLWSSIGGFLMAGVFIVYGVVLAKKFKS